MKTAVTRVGRIAAGLSVLCAPLAGYFASAAQQTQPLDARRTAPSSSCAIVSDKGQPVAAGGREVYCVIDIGSRNVKLVVSSTQPDNTMTLRDERSCRARLDLGTKVYDAGAPAGRQDRPLLAADIEALASVMQEYQALCALDRGKMMGADATEWARHATNMAEIKQALAAKTGITIDVLTPDQEARYGYAAATRGRPGYLVVDAGSNSFQITSQPQGREAPQGVSVPLGYEQASNLYFLKAASYEAGRRSYADEVRRRVSATSLDLAGLRAVIASGKLGRRMVALGQDAAIQLIVGGALRDASGEWLRDELAYSRKSRQVHATELPEYGEVTAVLSAAQIGEYLHSLRGSSQWLQLRTDPIRAIYGNKALVVPALFDELMRELGVDSVVLTPAEMPAGYVLAKARSGPR